MNGAIELGWDQLAVAGALVFVAGVVSVWLRLQLGSRLLVASVRTVVQLLLVGYLLRFIFGMQGPLLLFGYLVVMTVAAARAAIKRPSRTYRGAFGGAFVTLVLAGWITTFVVTALVVRVEPWYRAQYLLPLLGMILGNGLTGISLSLDALLESLDAGRDSIETELALGANRWEAVRDPLREALRRGMIPILNAMTVVGIVSLPGMMTGQILAGADPLGAVKYQIVVMFMLAAATAVGCMGVLLHAYRRLFDRAHRLRHDRLLRR